MRRLPRTLWLLSLTACLAACSDQAPSEAPEAAEPRSSPTLPEHRDRANTPPRDAGPGMIRLMEAYDAAPKIPGISSTERLAKWAAWADDHMPDATDRERVYAAHVLSVEELKRERGPLAATPLSGLPLMTRMLDAWRVDADGDGTLADDELDAAATLPNLMHWPQGMRMTPSAREMRGPLARGMTIDDVAFDGPLPERPSWFMLGIADTDGDGRLTEAEWARAIVEHTNRAEARARAEFERLAAARLDANDNGRFDDAERSDLASSAGQLQSYGLSPYDPWLYPFMFERLQREHLPFEYPEVAPPVTGTTTLLPRPKLPPSSAVFGLVSSESPTPPPDPATAATEHAAFQTYLQFRQRADHDSRYLGFVAVLDTDGDEALSTAEWEQGLAELPRQHEREVFRRFYDTNTDGRISDPEIADFMRWHDNRGLRADANFDGQVDHRDIVTFVEFLRSQ